MNLYWLQSGGCSGDTMSILNYEGNLFQFFSNIGIEILWHPSLSTISPKEHDTLLENILNGTQVLDILCIEGNVVCGPDGSGMFDTFRGKPKKELIEALCQKASYVIAVGTCASYGGIGSYDEMQGIGLQFHHEQEGGYLGKNFRTKDGHIVINLPGCPIQPKALENILNKVKRNMSIDFTKEHTDVDYYNFTVHQGCTRNEYHEYKIEESDFAQKGCMFFHLGCKGPTTLAPCNKYLWNEVNSKTRAGVPCFGCTRPDFPQPYPFFETQNIIGTPLELPRGVDRAHYLAYKDMAWAASPQRLKKRTQRV